MAEHARITKYFAPLTAQEPGAFLLQDDAAVLTPPTGQSLVITTDSVIEGIHVLPHATPQQFVQKLLRRNLSDLAAMGANPWRYTLNLHTPRGMSDNWFALFAAALREEQEHFGLVLIGGDSTSGNGPIHITMTCFGLINGAPLQRSGAQIGDDIYVSDTLGDAAHALDLLQQNQSVSAAHAARYHVPEPRLALGQALHKIASACIDISDGLVADLSHICEASNVAATIEATLLPRNAGVPIDAALNGGDDYELLFSASPLQRDAIYALAKKLSLPLTRIGSISIGSRVTVLDVNGQPRLISTEGWEHA